jgi:hypothetical protein
MSEDCLKRFSAVKTMATPSEYAEVTELILHCPTRVTGYGKDSEGEVTGLKSETHLHFLGWKKSSSESSVTTSKRFWEYLPSG